MPTSAGWRYDHDHGEWRCVEAATASTEQPVVGLDRPLRLATLNCLHDLAQDELLQHAIRYEAICRELQALDADLIGLNEVTTSLLDRVLQADWVRRSYTVSAASHEALCSDGRFGNLLLSRIPPVSVTYIDHQPADGRRSHAMALSIRSGGDARCVVVCSTHLKAFPWLMEGRRRMQLQHLTAALTTTDPESSRPDACVYHAGDEQPDALQPVD